ncbi:MauE/DoxX family redox-associated membrane protein [Actinophytocola xanthii]|uniref:Methylamine utilisation protein MauE domain-containing protein n=1 Tax=Actinophytocola xanthii TaxID=1912961 RepID=A0A1Q8C8U6_9PSEU|nr:MauE/DoxX family redox-associated membrane protein [Actinophytocola xanthii]OLF10792.1 hypothetical protein BU204_31355 [Actinophytocola xanthii]
MLDWLAGVQQFLVGGVLVWASTVKLGTGAPAAARRSALRRLVGERFAVVAYRAVGVVELLLGALLVLPPAVVVEAYLATALLAGMLGYLAYARLRAPESGCGCLGDTQVPVRGRAFGRVGFLLVAAGLAGWSTGWWPQRPLAAVALLVLEVAVVVALSPELDRRWLLPLRRWRVRMSHPLGSVPAMVPLESSVQQLERSDAYRAAVNHLRSDLLDSWEEGDWRLLTYAAATAEGPATAVFAVPLRDYRPEEIRVALVPEPEPSPV